MAKVHYLLTDGPLSESLEINLEALLKDELIDIIKKDTPDNPTNDERWKQYINSYSEEYIGFKNSTYYKEKINSLRNQKKAEVDEFYSKHSDLLETIKSTDWAIEIVFNEDIITLRALSNGEEIEEFDSITSYNILSILFSNISENTKKGVKRNLPLIDYNRQQLQNTPFEIPNQFYGDLNKIFHLGDANWEGSNEYKVGVQFEVFGTKVSGNGYLAEAKFDHSGIVWNLTEKEDYDY